MMGNLEWLEQSSYDDDYIEDKDLSPIDDDFVRDEYQD